MDLRKIFLVGCGLLLASGGLVAEETAEKPPVSYRDALWLGVVEGITEFLPISSTAHLILMAEWLDLNDQTPLYQEGGEPIWYETPTEGSEGIMMTRKHAVDTYNVVLQGGTILAVVFLYWRTIVFLVMGCLRMQEKALRMSFNIFLAFLPIVPLGILIEPLILQLFQTGVLVWGMLVGTLAIVAVELWRRARLRPRRRPATGRTMTEATAEQAKNGFVEQGTVDESNFGERSWDQLSWKQAMGIGFIQCLALIPGFSRALSAILGGYLVGLRPGQAAEFSFLVGLPTVFGAALYKGYKDGALMLEVVPAGPLLFGMLVSAITAVVAVWWLRNHIRKWGLWGFVVYRMLLVGAIFAVGGAAV